MEHFITLASHHFLPQVLALAASLRRHAGEHRLWVLAMDQEMERALAAITWSGIQVIPLREIEDERLLAVKPGRTIGEYCWTVASFTYDAVFARAPDAQRVTYLDADLWFLRDPAELLGPFAQSGRHVLVTEHGFAPEQSHLLVCGRFCVQFLTFDRTLQATAVRRWWQERNLEWCFNRLEADRFGDQKYLDRWPDLFGEDLWIVQPPWKCLGPWNAQHALAVADAASIVFIHLHGLRLLSGRVIRLWDLDHQPGRRAEALWSRYLGDFAAGCRMAESVGCPLATWPERIPQGLRSRLRWLIQRWKQRRCYVPLDRLVPTPTEAG